MWRPRLAGRFGADIILPDLLVDLASCDRRRDFTRPMRSVHGPGCPVEGIQGLAAHLARATRDQPPSTKLSDAGPDTRRLWRARGTRSPHQHEFLTADRIPGGVPRTWPEKQKIGRREQAAARAISYLNSRAPTTTARPADI